MSKLLFSFNLSMLSVQQVGTAQVQASLPQQKVPLLLLLAMYLNIRPTNISKARRVLSRHSSVSNQ